MVGNPARPLTRLETIRVLVAENTPMNAQLLADGLHKFQRLEVVGSAARSSEVLRAATSVNPQVAVISANLDEEPSKGFAIAGELCDSLPEAKAVLLLDSSKPDLVVAAFRAGAKGSSVAANL